MKRKLPDFILEDTRTTHILEGDVHMAALMINGLTIVAESARAKHKVKEASEFRGDA